MLNEVMNALAEPRRREIMLLLRGSELPSGDIAAQFSDVTPPAISQHLGVLTTAGLLRVRKEGTRRLYRLEPAGLMELRDFLALFWDDSLQRLKQAAEAEQEETGPEDG